MTNKKMGRPPGEHPKNKKMTIRISERDMAMVEECSERLGISKTDVMIKGLGMVYDSIKK